MNTSKCFLSTLIAAAAMSVGAYADIGFANFESIQWAESFGDGYSQAATFGYNHGFHVENGVGVAGGDYADSRMWTTNTGGKFTNAFTFSFELVDFDAANWTDALSLYSNGTTHGTTNSIQLQKNDRGELMVYTDKFTGSNVEGDASNINLGSIDDLKGKVITLSFDATGTTNTLTAYVNGVANTDTVTFTYAEGVTASTALTGFQFGAAFGNQRVSNSVTVDNIVVSNTAQCIVQKNLDWAGGDAGSWADATWSAGQQSSQQAIGDNVIANVTFASSVEMTTDANVWLGSLKVSNSASLSLVAEKDSTLNVSEFLWVDSGTLNLGSGVDVRTSTFRIANQGASTVNIKSGATLTITGEANDHTASSSLLLSHGGYASTLNLVGGTLIAESAEMKMSWDGAGTFSAQSGEARLKGLNFWGTGSGGAALKGHFILGSKDSGSAKVYLGSSGINELTANGDSLSVVLGNGTLGATDSWSTSSNSSFTPVKIQLVGSNGGTVFDTEDPDDFTGHTITINHVMEGEGELVKSGKGTLVLTKENTYSGGTTISQGKLVAAHENALGTGAVTINDGQLELSASNVTIAGLSGAEGAKVTTTVSDSDSPTLTINGGGTFAGSIAPGGAKLLLVKTGAETLTLSGSNNYKGGTTISGGTLVAAHKNALGASDGTVTVGAGASLVLNANMDGTERRYVLAGGTLVSSVKTTSGEKQIAQGDAITLTDNSTVRADANFGMISSGWNKNNLVLNGHTLTKTGAGTFFLSQTTVTQGAIYIEEGTILCVPNSLANGGNSDASEAAITIRAGSGKLDVTTTDFKVGSLTLEVSDSYTDATLLGSGTLTVGDGQIVIKRSDAATLNLAAGTAYTYQIAASDATFDDNWTVNSFELEGWGTGWYVADYSNGQLTLTIPEPSTFGLLAGLGALTLVGTRRRRKKA